MTKDEALKLVLADIEANIAAVRTSTITAIKEALAQPQQEPVAGMVLVPYEPCFEMQEQGSMASDYDLSQSRVKRVYQAMIDMHQVLEEKEPSDKWFQLNAGYTSPPQRTWVKLTDDERNQIWYTVGNADPHGDVDGWSGRDVMDAIEAKLKAKNEL